ncbi:hypothetical protein [Microbacterium sp. NPDC096154]|uniref:hypothetical protein n=1 Tax=Microbacterium sp. NPDC096154 TaxID=3155549 RepID=UPI00331856B4
MTTRQQRVLRGAVWASVATLLAATSHTLAGGAAPSPLLVAAVAVLLTPATAALAGPRPGLGRLAAVVPLGQAAFHGVFALLGSPTGTASGGAPHVHGAADLLQRSAQAAAAVPDVVAPPAESAAMYVAHAIAALVTVALLWRGERLVRAVAGGVVAVLRRFGLTRAPLVARPVSPAAAPAVRRAAAVLLSSASRRGPPLALGA